MRIYRFILIGLLVLAIAAIAWAQGDYFVYMPIIAQAPSSTPTRTATPTKTPIPCPASTPALVQTFTNNGIRGDYFRLSNNLNCFNPGEDVWFEFSATNTNTNAVYVGGLGAYWCTDKPGQCTQASWGDFSFSGTSAGADNNVLEWNDHLNIATSGTYQVRLGVCWLGSRTDCENNPGAWQALSGPITIVIR